MAHLVGAVCSARQWGLGTVILECGDLAPLWGRVLEADRTVEVRPVRASVLESGLNLFAPLAARGGDGNGDPQRVAAVSEGEEPP